MSKDKHKVRDRSMVLYNRLKEEADDRKLYDNLNEGACCPNKITITKELRYLIDNGYIKIERKCAHSYFGNHIRYTYLIPLK
jgi:hypothetical protein